MSSAAQQQPDSSSRRTIVHKFGGTSVADAERFRHVAGLLLARDEDEQITVVSAMKGVTDALIELCELAARSRNDWRDPSLWKRYAGHFSPYLQRRIAALQAEQSPRRRVRKRAALALVHGANGNLA